MNGMTVGRALRSRRPVSEAKLASNRKKKADRTDGTVNVLAKETSGQPSRAVKRRRVSLSVDDDVKRPRGIKGQNKAQNEETQPEPKGTGEAKATETDKKNRDRNARQRGSGGSKTSAKAVDKSEEKTAEKSCYDFASTDESEPELHLTLGAGKATSLKSKSPTPTPDHSLILPPAKSTPIAEATTQSEPMPQVESTPTAAPKSPRLKSPSMSKISLNFYGGSSSEDEGGPKGPPTGGPKGPATGGPKEPPAVRKRASLDFVGDPGKKTVTPRFVNDSAVDINVEENDPRFSKTQPLVPGDKTSPKSAKANSKSANKKTSDNSKRIPTETNSVKFMGPGKGTSSKNKTSNKNKTSTPTKLTPKKARVREGQSRQPLTSTMIQDLLATPTKNDNLEESDEEEQGDEMTPSCGVRTLNSKRLSVIRPAYYLSPGTAVPARKQVALRCSPVASLEKQLQQTPKRLFGSAADSKDTILEPVNDDDEVYGDAQLTQSRIDSGCLP